MMANVPSFMGQDFMSNMSAGRNPEQRSSCQQATRNEASSLADPFNRMSTIMEELRKEMLGMQSKHGSQPSDSSGHSMNSSSVMTYAKVGSEPPKIFQASSHVHNVPGGIKETRRAVKDSESGVEKMSIGHHIQDRAHVIQKYRNQRTGDEEIDQEFINLNEAGYMGKTAMYVGMLPAFKTTETLLRLRNQQKAIEPAAVNSAAKVIYDHTLKVGEGLSPTYSKCKIT
ncbi:myeloid leukemia factor 1 isoform X2 [Cetorhinus maximus]